MKESKSNIPDRDLNMAENYKNISRRFDCITENSPSGIFILNQELEIEYVNQKFCFIFELAEANLIGLKFIDLFPGQLCKTQVLDCLSDDTINSDRASSFNLVSSSGDKTRVQVNSSIMEDVDGNKIYVGHILDITSTWRASQLQYAVFEISQAVSTSTNLTSLFKSIHSIMGSIIDITNFYIALCDEEQSDLNFPYYIDENDEQPEPQKFSKGLTEYIIRLGEPMLITEQDIYSLADQGKIDLLGTPSKIWMGSPLIIDNRTIGAVVVQSYSDEKLYNMTDLGILNYVSEQIAFSIRNKIASDALQQEKFHFEELFQGSPEGIILVDEKSNIHRVNKEFVNIFGYSTEEAVGKNIDDLITDSWQKEEAQSITRQVANGERVKFETVRFRKDGSPVYVSILSAPVLRKEKRQAVYAIYRDITDRKMWEEQIRSSEEKYRRLSGRLSETNNMKDLLLDVITHDLKNPAGVISGMSEIIISESDDPSSIELIKESSDNLLKVIENATTLSKITFGDEIKKEDINLAEMLIEISNEYSAQFLTAGISFINNLKSDLQVRANPIIAEIFRNYLSNAIKYAADGKKIIIDDISNSGTVTIRVSDYGKTIAEEDRKSIFRRSIQLANTEKRGRGLGLAIVERIAAVHNASVWVEPNNPVGNSFCLKIPRA